jgi:hypothetical protein
MIATPMRYPFLKNAARILNAGQSRSLLLHGNVHDLFFAATKKGALPDGQAADPLEGCYQPLGRVLVDEWSVPGLVMLVYELNGPIRFPSEAVREKVKRAWISWRAGLSADELALQGLLDPRSKREADDLASEFERQLLEVMGNPTVALEFLRQLCLCSRSKTRAGESIMPEDLLVLVEEADLLLPEGNIATLSRADRHRVGIVFDWFSDPEFQSGGDSVVLVAESPSLVHQRVTRLPYVLTVEVPAPDEQARAHFLAWFAKNQQKDRPLKLWANDEHVRDRRPLVARVPCCCSARSTAAASSARRRRDEQGGGYIQRQLGEDVVEFKRPTHTLADVIGFTRLKSFLDEELVPRLRSTGKDALTGAAVSGPIGGGKSFIFEAVASELDFPVLVLKNIRSQWFGQTDVIFERLRRTLLALGKVMIFVDEADTQFGGVGPDAHETERRLTGKIQAMISDPELRGRVVWLLMTARIHQLSPDLRRPGRVGDLIIPVLDPEGDDRLEFLRWVLKGSGLETQPKAAAADGTMKELDRLTRGWSAASFASLRATLAAAAVRAPLTSERLVAIVADQISPSIERTRRYQTLQALVNCTRRSLLPDPKVSDADREAWQREILQLEREGVR